MSACVREKSGTSVEVLPVEDIQFIEAADDYVELYTAKAKHLKQKTMHYFEQHLDPELFVRVHRSYIVAVSQIARLEPYTKDSFVLILKNRREVSVSKSGYKNLKEKLGF